MAQALARFGSVRDEAPQYRAGHLALAVSVFADRPQLRGEIGDDAVAAGFRLTHGGTLADLHGDEARPLGEVVLIDAPLVDGATLAALARVDMRAARAGAQLVVSTSLAALDDVFGCLDQSGAQVLVEPSRAERVIALGRVLATMPRGRVRELTEDDRLTLLRLTEQVGLLAERLHRMGMPHPLEDAGDGPRLRLESPAISFAGAPSDDGSERLVRSPRPALPDPRLIRRIIRQRQLRARFFDGELFADPAWDMLLDLAASRAEHKLSVTSLCIASGVPPTTALRWIPLMSEAGLLERVEDETPPPRLHHPHGSRRRRDGALFCRVGARGRAAGSDDVPNSLSARVVPLDEASVAYGAGQPRARAARNGARIW